MDDEIKDLEESITKKEKDIGIELQKLEQLKAEELN